VLWSIPTGLFVVGSRSGERSNLMTANLVVQVSTTPAAVAVAIESGSVTRGLIEAGGAYSVCILDRLDRPLVRRFVKPVEQVERDARGSIVSMQGEPVFEVAGGLPVLEASIGWIACRVDQSVDPGGGTPGSGSHRLFIAEVVAAGGRAVTSDDPTCQVLRMEDTRMHYGG
jgi:flavin reductase (DIM6/NTAB) family NADH-FMN oxidoreductase RutF